jgi:hypothetical protein
MLVRLYKAAALDLNSISIITTSNNPVSPQLCGFYCGKSAIPRYCVECTNSVCLDCFKKCKEIWFTTQRIRPFGCQFCGEPIGNDHHAYNLCTKEENARWNPPIGEAVTTTKKTLRTRLSEYRIILTTTKCPGCKMRVKKLDGCNHIQCICGTDFCYRCGEKTDDEYEHICRKLRFIRSRP